MTLTLYNTLTRKKEPFTPIDPQNVRMYVCGPTVYDFAHIGNARPVIVFDVLYRLLRHVYGADHVTYARNITDVDDKINARALRDFPGLPLNDAIARVTSNTADQFHADVKALGCLEPTIEPRATDNIQQMIDIIVQLLTRGHAYVAAGEVLFDTVSMPDYGQLSKRNLDEQQAGSRIEVDAHKKNPGDFVLWKLSSADEPGWESPWGRGRPGWHIECSAMSARYLGETFDIHGGGLDLIFPHHENEIAQSRCAHGTSVMANVWMHNGFLQVEGEKMSKSLGNFVTINELLETERFGGQRWAGDVLRMTMLRTHYRQPIDWTQTALRENQKAWASMGNAIRDVSEAPEHDQEFLAAMLDDLNTPAAFARLFALRDEATGGISESARKLRKAFSLLGFLREWSFNEEITVPISESHFELSRMVPDVMHTNADIGLWQWAAFFENNYPEQSLELVAFLKKFSKGVVVRDLRRFSENWDRLLPLDRERLAARRAKDFKESDRIRDELASMGIALKDSKDPATGEIVTTWEVAR